MGIVDSFAAHAATKGVKLHSDDIKSLKKLIPKFRPEVRKKLLLGYLEKNLEAREKEHRSVRKENAGRYAANCWIREIKEKNE